MGRVWRKIGTFNVGDYETLGQASSHTGFCKNQLAYSIFSKEPAYRNWRLGADQNLDFKNKGHLTTLNPDTSIREKKFTRLLNLPRFSGKNCNHHLHNPPNPGLGGCVSDNYNRIHTTWA